jgi:hypothetical protein
MARIGEQDGAAGKTQARQMTGPRRRIPLLGAHLWRRALGLASFRDDKDVSWTEDDNCERGSERDSGFASKALIRIDRHAWRPSSAEASPGRNSASSRVFFVLSFVVAQEMYNKTPFTRAASLPQGDSLAGLGYSGTGEPDSKTQHDGNWTRHDIAQFWNRVFIDAVRPHSPPSLVFFTILSNVFDRDLDIGKWLQAPLVPSPELSSDKFRTWWPAEYLTMDSILVDPPAISLPPLGLLGLAIPRGIDVEAGGAVDHAQSHCAATNETASRELGP